MDEIPFKNREIKEMSNDVKRALERIEIQTTKTNGRVTKLEWWKQWSTGGFSIVILILLPAIGWLFLKTIDTPNKSDTQLMIQEAVAQALLPYATK